MKRITWWPQLWLGLTFNWAVLVAYAAKTGTLNPPLLILYAGLIFWTVGYDTIYACQDIEDDMKIGVKSTARRFGKRIKLGVGINYLIAILLMWVAISITPLNNAQLDLNGWSSNKVPKNAGIYFSFLLGIIIIPMAIHLLVQVLLFNPRDGEASLKIFKSNLFAGLLFPSGLLILCLFFIIPNLTPS